jgi:hypothetical protein
MALDYKLINNVSSDVRNEIRRRESYYWPTGAVNSEQLAWNYQKTAYILLSAFDPITKEKIGTISIPTRPILGLYNLDTGVINGAVLNSAEITTDGTNGTYGAVSRVTVNFTVFDIYQLDTYIDKFLKPGQDVELEYGWTVNDNLSVNNGSIRGTVYNFSFSAKEDGTWECTLHAMGATSMTYGWGIDQASTSYTTNPTEFRNDSGLLDIFKRIQDSADYVYDTYATTTLRDDVKLATLQDVLNAGLPAKKDFPDYSQVQFYIYNLPINKEATLGTRILNIFSYIQWGATSKEGEVVNSKVAYITLENFIKLINILLKRFSKIPLPEYTLDGCVGNDYREDFLKTGPADFTKFVFSTQVNGNSDPKLNFDIFSVDAGAAQQMAGSVLDLSKLILINCSFLYNELQSILDNKTNVVDKKVITFLNSIFQQLETDTGGIISITMSDGPIDQFTKQVRTIQILNQNGVPATVEENINSLMIPAFTKGSVVRSISIDSKVPDAIQAEVSTYIRTPKTYVGSAEADTESAITELTTLGQKLNDLNNNFMSNIQTDTDAQTSSLQQWAADVRGVYRKLYTIQQNFTLGGSGKVLSKHNIFNQKTAIYPITLKITLDGMHGFQYGNSITTNWIPTQYQKAGVYWTVTKIRHVIQNNDWTTELESIYRVKS